MQKRILGIIAGGGALPVEVAKACTDQDLPFYMVRLSGFAGSEIEKYPGEECSIAEVGKIIYVLNEHECTDVVLAGLVDRPDFKKLKPDLRGARLLPKVIAAARHGDGALLKLLVEVLEGEGFKVIGVDDITKSILAKAGTFGAIAPSPAHLSDIKKAASVIDALGKFDIGQGAVVAAGHVLAVEAAEGTDKMLARCADFSDDLRGSDGANGVLVKRPKPDQELRVDLPTIGVETIKRIAAAKLAGVAVEADRALVMDAAEMIAEADRAGIFVYGFSAAEIDD